MENGIFSRSGKHNPSVKGQKNVFRAACVIGCSLLSWAGSQSLDKFVSLIGSFAWYVCPSLDTLLAGLGVTLHPSPRAVAPHRYR